MFRKKKKKKIVELEFARTEPDFTDFAQAKTGRTYKFRLVQISNLSRVLVAFLIV